jgi:hypothetical protein
MIFFENGPSFMRKPNVCVRDTKVRKFLGLGTLVHKKTVVLFDYDQRLAVKHLL